MINAWRSAAPRGTPGVQLALPALVPAAAHPELPPRTAHIPAEPKLKQSHALGRACRNFHFFFGAGKEAPAGSPPAFAAAAAASALVPACRSCLQAGMEVGDGTQEVPKGWLGWQGCITSNVQHLLIEKEREHNTKPCATLEHF